MKTCPLKALLESDFNFTFINSLQQFWHGKKSFSCIGKPKKQHLLLYADGCKLTYNDHLGNTYIAKSGDVVYTPIGSQYNLHLSDFHNENSGTIGINFLLTDEKGEAIKLYDGIKIFPASSNPEIAHLFYQSISYDTVKPFAKNKILFLKILCALVNYESPHRVPEALEGVITYLSDHIEETPTVTQLAGICGVSEVYFRKIFKKHTGMSPLVYRNTLRLSRAKSYLEYGDITIQEISDILGYATASHFIKEFRTHYGCSPLKYRKNTTNGSFK